MKNNIEIVEEYLFNIHTLMDFYKNKNYFDLGFYLTLIEIEVRELLERLQEE